MQRWKNSLFNICFALNCLLVFLLLFENRFALPPWLQVTGRMHPLLVHFPIVLVVLYALGSFIPVVKKNDSDFEGYTIYDALLFLTALSSVIAALMGLFLSREEGYDADALLWHKWSGVVLSVFTLAWYYYRKLLLSVRVLPYFISLVALGIILVTGHQGAAITHGQDFLFAPITPEKTSVVVPFDEAMVFADMVKPILSAKCISCHNSKKAKGDLIMESEEELLRGGKTGKLWDSLDADFGLLLQRVHLPLKQKKHMPPDGKPQLTEEELAIIERWIKKGSDFTVRVADLPVDDTLRLIGVKNFMTEETVQYDFDEADPAAIRKLNTVNRVVTKESLQSPALAVSFFNSRLFDREQLKELEIIKKQIVSLDLSKMPLKDDDLKIIGEFDNLRRLHLNFTAITGASFPVLQKLKFLRILSLSGTQVSAKQLDQLRKFPKLKTVYAWNIPVDTLSLKKIRQNAGSIRFETGFPGDTMALKLSPPLFENEQLIITNAVPLKLKHYLPGVLIRYTSDNTDPDSIGARVYKPGEMINETTVVRARAFKPGWTGSEIVEGIFFKNTYKADTIILLTSTDSTYSGSGKFLSDLDKGTTNYRAGNWLAWRKKGMEVLMEYQKPVLVQSVTLSSVVDIKSYIMAPLSIEIWGGQDRNKLQLLGRIKPEQPAPMKEDSLRKHQAFLKGFECRFAPVSLKYIKIIGTPVSKLPDWHPGKGDKGYIFVDEILVN